MHFNVDDRTRMPANPQQLTDVQGTVCVAACYKCLMSYYNQPDHELLDRRDPLAREFLLNLAHSRTNILDRAAPPATNNPKPSEPILVRWLEIANTMQLPTADSDPLIVEGVRLPLVWRDHYVACVLGQLPEPVATTLRARGFEVIIFDDPDSTWAAPFGRLAAALGKSQ
jgi:hypothetical protein